MKKELVSAKVPKNPEKGIPNDLTATIEVQVPETAEEAIKMYGDDAVLSNALANWRVTLQANIRSALRRGESPKQIQERLKDAKMGVAIKGTKMDPVQAFLAKFQASTPEDQKKLLAELQKRAAQK